MKNEKLTPLGAEIVEHHFLLSKQSGGPDMILLTERFLKQKSGFIDQSRLVEDLFIKGFFEFEQISHFVDYPFGSNGNLEFYAIPSHNSYFIDCLKDIGAHLLINNYGVWWSRYASNQPLYLDDSIEMIAAHYFKKGWLK